ncbi:MAG TPA: aminotransferase class V-fold PLP-dependent enzyme [Caulobacteraceae bacterium]|jgi:cysteine desulfurase|nr:aminotransferase class V-fold PLP-dependent enzyme [Caulobacteraceae bacterium]
MSVYLDYNATAKIRPEARAAALAAMELGANPSSTHAAGRRARAVVEQARAEVAALAGARTDAVTFVSGGVEANALAMWSARADGCARVIAGATEHDCVLASAQAAFEAVEIWPVDGQGVADLDWLESALARGGRTLVCLMAANNETGVIQPLAEARALTEAAGAWLHVDAVQAAGKLTLGIRAETLALSAHKLGGPQGVGALIAAAEATITRALHGGGQERGRRAGTENLSGIAGFGAAAAVAGRDLPLAASQSRWRDRLAGRMESAGAIVLGAGAARLPQTLCVATPGFSSEVQVMGLDLAGVMVSAGAACSSGKVKASRVVEAMGRPDLAACSIRISGGWASSEADWITCGEAWSAARETRRARLAEVA